MNDKIMFGDILIQPIHFEKEVNYTILAGVDYLFRLVPAGDGFELSPLDKALQPDIDSGFIKQIGEFISCHFM